MICTPVLPLRSLGDVVLPLFNAFICRIEASGHDRGSMGDLEESIARDMNEVQRHALEHAAQTKADGCDSTRCPECRTRLKRLSHGHERSVHTRFGSIVVCRTKGYCPKCEKWFFPADLVLGLDKRATASPSMQEAAALLVSKMPAEEAARVLERLTGRAADDSTMARQAKRQGERARQLRKKMDEQASSVPGRWEVTGQLREELEGQDFTMVIEMDAWLIRERDGWGRKLDPGASRWHWVWTATVFRLDQRCQTQSKRPIILSRGFVATREGMEEFSRQVYAEAVRQGLLLARDVLVVADGGVWIWKIAGDRFAQARGRLDFYHASEHLWAVAAELHGAATEAARKWVEPLLHQLRHGEETGVIETLEQLARTLGEQHPQLVTESNYFRSHAEHLSYAAGAEAGEPIGSGAIESTCRQYQCRFKRPGQFWSLEGDEALLALETLWRNGRWHLLFPHITQNHAHN